MGSSGAVDPGSVGVAAAGAIGHDARHVPPLEVVPDSLDHHRTAAVPLENRPALSVGGGGTRRIHGASGYPAVSRCMYVLTDNFL